MTWRLARCIPVLQRELDAAFPNRVKPDWTLGDPAHASRDSDHNPNDAGVVTGLDVRGRATAQALWDHLLETRDERVKYAIFDGQIVSSTTSPWTPRRYTGTNPHSDHMHISFGRGPDGSSTRADLYDSTRAWNIGRKGDWFSMASKKDLRRIVREVVQNQVPKLVRAELQRLANGPGKDGWNARYINLKDVEKRIRDDIKGAS